MSDIGSNDFTNYGTNDSTNDVFVDLIGGDEVEDATAAPVATAAAAYESQAKAVDPVVDPVATAYEPQAKAAAAVDLSEAARIAARIAELGDVNQEVRELEARRIGMINAKAAHDEGYAIEMGGLMQERERAMKARQWTSEELRLLLIALEKLQTP